MHPPRHFARPFSASLFAALYGGRLRSYLEILLVGSGARIFGLASQLVVLVILGRILSKESFGDLMTAFGFYRLAATALGVGGSLVLLFHVSRRPNDVALEVKLHRYSALLGAVVAAAVALAGLFAAEPIAAWLGKPGLASWLRQLAPFAVFSTLLIVSTGALEGRSLISRSIVLGEAAPNAVRIIFLPLVAWLDLPHIYVAHVLTVSVLIPWLWSAHRLWDTSVSGLRSWRAWDYTYCGKFVAATLFANQLGTIDILVAGVLFSSEAVADYAVASRIAALFGFFQLAILKRFAPRAGRLIEASDFPALRQEVELCRKLMIGCGALTISGLLLVAPFLLPLFGDYGSAQTFLILLAIPTFVQSFYETSDRLLIMAGQANIPLLLTASSFFVLTTTPFMTASWLGMAAIPAAMIVSTLLFNPMAAIRARKLFGVQTVRLGDVILLVAGSAMLAAYALLGSMPARLAACGLLAGIGLFALRAAVRASSAISAQERASPISDRQEVSVSNPIGI
jgi:O-antigen/teichoic acid export membrane protein